MIFPLIITCFNSCGTDDTKQVKSALWWPRSAIRKKNKSNNKRITKLKPQIKQKTQTKRKTQTKQKTKTNEKIETK